MSKARSLMDALEKYKPSGRNEFFALKDHKDTAVVRFLYNEDPEDLDWYVVHEATIGGKKRWLQCPETPDCPSCRRGNNPQLKIFIQLIDDRDGKIKTWERGRNFVGKIIELQQKYGSLYARKFEVERNGGVGDPNTDYEMYALQPDNADISQLPQRQELLGENGFILQKSIADMEAIMNGTYVYQPVEGDGQPVGANSNGYPQPPNSGGQYQQPPQPNYQQQNYQQPPQQNYQQPPQPRTNRQTSGTDIF